jgi:hypothetical protein
MVEGDGSEVVGSHPGTEYWMKKDNNLLYVSYIKKHLETLFDITTFKKN